MEFIANYNSYIELMKNGFYDKLFFIDKIFGHWDTIVDYGCADGSITRQIKEIFPEKNVIGYDNDLKMIEETYKVVSNQKIFYTNKLQEAKGDVLYLSSIVHEVYSYRSAEEIDKFWEYVFKSGFKYIVIRDMIYDEEIQRESKINIVRKIYNWCSSNHFNRYLKEFENLNGPITHYKNLVHFLLKYKYTKNWEREVRENYLPLSIQRFYQLIPNNYRIDYHEHYTLPFFKNDWENNFDIYVDDKIYSKIILKLI